MSLCRNAHPSTALLQRVTETQSPEPGIIAISSLGIHLLSHNSKAADVSRSMCPVHLAGVPTAIQHLKHFQWALADSMAELWIVNLGNAQSLCKITADIPLTIAHFLCLLPDAESQPGKQCCTAHHRNVVSDTQAVKRHRFTSCHMELLSTVSASLGQIRATEGKSYQHVLAWTDLIHSEPA